jgi:hypothetical protein
MLAVKLFAHRTFHAATIVSPISLYRFARTRSRHNQTIDVSPVWRHPSFVGLIWQPHYCCGTTDDLPLPVHPAGYHLTYLS